MTFSYDAAGLTVALNRIRLEIGDTDSDRPLLQDEEIEQILVEQSVFNLRVAACCHLICSIFAGKAERYRIEGFSETKAQIYNRYKEMAERYAARGGGAPWMGSIEDSFKDATEEDTSLVKPLFKRGMHDI